MHSLRGWCSMSRQLSNTPRHSQLGTDQHKRECIERVISKNLVSKLRFQNSQTLTHGFITKNRIDAVGVVERFLSSEKRLPSPSSFAGDLLAQLKSTNDNLVYTFPSTIALERELALSCACVEIKRHSDSVFTTRFGEGFSSPKLCSEVSYPQLPIQHLFFELLHIPHTAGTKAFSTKATVLALCEQFQQAGISAELPRKDEIIVCQHGIAFSVTASLLYCSNSSSTPIQTKNGLFVIPVKTIPSMSGVSDDKIRVSVSVIPDQDSRLITDESKTDSILRSTSDFIHRSILTLYGALPSCNKKQG